MADAGCTDFLAVEFAALGGGADPHPRPPPLAALMPKIRIGFGLGTRTLTNDAETFGAFVDVLERLRFDSLWLSERLTGDAPDPLVALAYAAGRTKKLKLGTSVLVVPGRNPVVLAKELASLDRLSGGRLLPAVGLGAPVPAEHRAFGVDRKERSAWFDEAIGLMRRLWVEDDVHHDGARFHVEGVTLRPRPVQEPIEMWLGGNSPSELRRTGRLGDGWLPSFCSVADVRDGWPVINATAAEHGREIDPEHLGVLIAYGRRRGARRGQGADRHPPTRSRPDRRGARSACRRCAAASRT